jgi:hypothetical protein
LISIVGNAKDFIIIDTNTFLFKKYSYPQNLLNIFKWEPTICWGTYDSEIIICYRTINNKLYLCYYNYIDNKINKIVNLSGFIKDKIITNNFTNMLLSPNKEKLVLFDYAFGIWVYNIKNQSIKELYYSSDYPINKYYVCDWDMNSNKILLLKNNILYECTIE